VRNGPAAALAACSLSIIGLIPSARAQPGEDCTVGREIVDDRGGPGTIVGGRGALCLVKYQDGHLQAWVPADQLRDPPEKSAAPEPGASPETPASPQPATPDAPVIMRPITVNRAVYRADALGHVTLTASVNGARVPFLVDTGASLVGLTPEDAKAAGIDPGQLTFNQSVHTANGTVRAAFVKIREIRLDELDIDDVPAVVIESLKQSVLGMSFLRRLKGFDMRNGALTMSW
jgi:aspartyl protease family protein